MQNENHVDLCMVSFISLMHPAHIKGMGFVIGVKELSAAANDIKA